MTIRNDSVIRTLNIDNSRSLIKHYKENKEKKTVCMPLINFMNTIVSACFRKRPGKLRLIMGLLIGSKMVGAAAQAMVENNIMFLS